MIALSSSQMVALTERPNSIFRERLVLRLGHLERMLQVPAYSASRYDLDQRLSALIELGFDREDQAASMTCIDYLAHVGTLGSDGEIIAAVIGERRLPPAMRVNSVYNLVAQNIQTAIWPPEGLAE